MAMDHFNNRDASVVPELANLDAQCTVYFPDPTLENSRADGAVSVRALWDSTIADELTRPCAVLGPLIEDANYDLQPALSALDMPMIVHHIESDLLAADDVPETMTLSLSAQGRALAMLQYLSNRTYLADWYPALEQDMVLGEVLEGIGEKFDLDMAFYMQKAPPQNVTEEAYTRQNLLHMKETGITTIMVSLKDASFVPSFAKLLDELDMLIDEFIYILSPSLVPVESLSKLFGEQVPDSAVDKFLRGALVFDRMDGFELNAEDTFTQAWRRQTEGQVRRLNELVPLTWLNAAPDYFQSALPAKGASFVYDAVMTIGFGACEQQRYEIEERLKGNDGDDGEDGESDEEDQGAPDGFEVPEGFSLVDTDNAEAAELAAAAAAAAEAEDAPETEDESFLIKSGSFLKKLFHHHRVLQSVVKPINGTLIGAMVMSNFTGASGHVSFGNEYAKSRNQEGITVGAYNVRPVDINPENGKRSYEATLTSKWTVEGGWEAIPNTQFIYRDGSTTAPSTLRRVFDANYITQSVRVIGLTLMCIALLISVVCIVLLGWLRKDPIVQRAQPFFMQILCVGSIIMSSAIFALSFDEDAGWSEDQLSVACTSFPWLFFIGHVLMFCALFTKLWRVDRVLQFRRQAVTITSALWPLLAFLGITTSILVVHTTLDPLVWVREVIQEAPVETYGTCTSDHMWAWFGPLAGLIFVSEILTMFFAWKTADIPEDFRDSEAVMYACFAQIQAWAVGIPMLAVLGTSSADATYFGRIFLIWIFSVSSVVVVVGPKIFKAIKMRLNPQLKRQGARVSVTGLYQPDATQTGTAACTVGNTYSQATNSVSRRTDSSPPSRWFMDGSKAGSVRSMQTTQTNTSAPPARWFTDPTPRTSSVDTNSTTGPPARWFMDSQATTSNAEHVSTVSQVESVGRCSTIEHGDAEEVEVEIAPPVRRPLSRGMSRGNNLIQMSMRHIDVRQLQGIEEADRIDEEADMMDSADNLELCNIDLEESSISSTNSSNK